MINRLMKDENGVLTFEWILLITLLVIGIIGGVAAIRDALIIECAETAGAIVALNQSYEVSGPWWITVTNEEGTTTTTTTGEGNEATTTTTTTPPSITMVETTGTKSEYVDTAGKVTVSETEPETEP